MWCVERLELHPSATTAYHNGTAQPRTSKRLLALERYEGRWG